MLEKIKDYIAIGVTSLVGILFVLATIRNLVVDFRGTMIAFGVLILLGIIFWSAFHVGGMSEKRKRREWK